MSKIRLCPAGPAWRAAEESGCDMSLLEENLRLSPAERFRHHDEAQRTIQMLQEGTRRNMNGTNPPPPSS